MDFFIYNQQKYFKVLEVKLQGFKLSCKHPNNIIQLNNGKIFIIDSILNINKNCAVQENIHNLYIYSAIENQKKEVFDFPTSSTDVGVMEIVSWEKDKRLVEIQYVHRKCILFNINNCQYILTLLHI